VESQKSQLVLGALAGFAATLPMTIAMYWMHARLPSQERYPLPPRELSESLSSFGMPTSTATLLYHFLYGAAAGSLYAAVSGNPAARSGALYAVAVWAGSYLGWIPAVRLLRPAPEHPARRNGVMITAHIVWGVCLAVGLGSLREAERRSFALRSSDEPRLKDIRHPPRPV
jgi:hypothetical protein